MVAAGSHNILNLGINPRKIWPQLIAPSKLNLMTTPMKDNTIMLTIDFIMISNILTPRPPAPYNIVAVNPASGAESTPLAVKTIDKPDVYWADGLGAQGEFCTETWECCDEAIPPVNPACPGDTCAVGTCIVQWPPPDGFTNFQEVNAATLTFAQIPGLNGTDIG